LVKRDSWRTLPFDREAASKSPKTRVKTVSVCSGVQEGVAATVAAIRRMWIS